MIGLNTKTVAILTYFDLAGEKHEIGAVKIGEFNMGKDQRAPKFAYRVRRIER